MRPRPDGRPNWREPHRPPEEDRRGGSRNRGAAGQHAGRLPVLLYFPRGAVGLRARASHREEFPHHRGVRRKTPWTAPFRESNAPLSEGEGQLDASCQFSVVSFQFTKKVSLLIAEN